MCCGHTCKWSGQIENCVRVRASSSEDCGNAVGVEGEKESYVCVTDGAEETMRERERGGRERESGGVFVSCRGGELRAC